MKRLKRLLLLIILLTPLVVFAGTAGYSYRLEGIEIVLVANGETPPGATDTPFIHS